MAGGPGGVQVGRVSIKVVPDFTHFRKLMRAVLQEFDGKEITVKVRADADALSGLTKDLNNSTKLVSKQMSKEISKGIREAGKDAKVAPYLDTKARYKRRLQNQLNKMFEQVEISLNFKGGNNQALMNELDKEFKQGQKQLDKLTPDLDTRDFAAQAAYVVATLKRVRDKTLQYRKDVLNPAGARVASDQVNEQAKKNIDTFEAWNRQVERTAQSLRRIDRAFAGATSGDKRQALREIIYGYRNMDAAITNMNRRQAGTVKLFGLEQEVVRITSVADRLRMRGGLVGAILGGATGLGVLEAAKNGIAAVGNATKGMSKAVTRFDPREFGLNIGTVGAAVASVGIFMVAAPLVGLVTAALLTLPGILSLIATPIAAITLGLDGLKAAAETIKEPFDALRKSLSEKVQAQFTPVFEQLKQIFPVLEAQMPKVSQGMADVAKSVVDFLTTGSGKTQIEETIAGIGTAIGNSAPGIRDFTAALVGLAHEFVTGGALEGVGQWFNDTMADFRNWVETTDLQAEFKGLGDALKAVLDTLGAMAGKGLDFLNDESKMAGFIETLKGVGSALEYIVQISNDVGEAWNAIMPAFNIGQGIVDIMQGDGQNAWRNFKEAFNAGSQADAPAMAADFSKTLTEGMKAGILLGNPLQGLDEASNEELNRLAYSIAQAGTQGVEQLNQAITAGGVETGVAQQIQAKVGAAVTGAMQALEPLKAGLQTEIDLALAPLGDLAGKLDSAFGGMGAKIQGSLSQIPGIVSQSLGSLGGVAALAMVPVAQAVQKGCDAAVLAAVFGAPKIVEPFRALGGQMSEVGASMMQGLGQGITANVGIAKAAAEQAAIEVKEAAKAAIRSKSPSKDFMDIGRDTQTGMAIGIGDNAKLPIDAIREVMQSIKDVFGSAEGLNLNFFMGQAASSMSDMASSSKEFRSNMVEAGTSPAISSGLDASELDDIKRQKAAIDLQIAQLQAQKNATQDKAAKAGLTAEIDQLRIQKERLDLLKEETGLQEDRKTAIQKLSDQIATNITDMIKMPGEFAKTTANAAMQDIGISGSGAIPTIANWALDAGTNFIFNVNNMDDALQGQQAQQRKQTAGIAGR